MDVGSVSQSVSQVSQSASQLASQPNSQWMASLGVSKLHCGHIVLVLRGRMSQNKKPTWLLPWEIVLVG